MIEYILMLNMYFVYSLINKKSYIFCFILFFIFVGLRMETGYDWIIYNDYFMSDKVKNIYGFEIGYVYWNCFLALFGKKELILNIGNTILFLSGLYFILKKNVRNIGLFMFIYFYMNILTLNMAIIRQGLSIIFFYIMINNKDSNKKYFYYLIAISFHISSIIYLPVLYICNKKYNKKTVIFFGFLGIIIFLFNIAYIENILNILSNIKVFSKLKYYIKIEHFNLGKYQIFYFIKNILLLYYIVFINKNKNRCIFFNLAVINLLSFCYFYEISTIYQRIENITSIGFIIYFCKLFENLNKSTKRLFYVIMFGYFNLFTIYFLTRPLSIVYVPYQNYLYTKKSTGRERTGILYRNLNLIFKKELFE